MHFLLVLLVLAHPAHRGKLWVCPDAPNGQRVTTACMIDYWEER